jgi:hypothetical protein
MSSAKVSCPYCPRSFVDENARRQHMKWRHKEPFPKSRALIADAMEALIFEAFDMPEREP